MRVQCRPITSSALKNAQFREASRQRLRCLESGKCSKHSAAMQAFDRLLMQVPEHTAGVAHVWFLMDNENYTNVQFDRARAQQPLGFILDNRNQADYNTTVNSWIEQRSFVTQAPALLQDEYPDLAFNITSSLDTLKKVVPPSPTGMTPSSCSALCSHAAVPSCRSDQMADWCRSSVTVCSGPAIQIL